VFTTPLVAIYFGVVSLISVISNLLTLWMITIVFYGILFCCLVGAIAPVAGVWVGSFLAWAIRYILGVTKLLAKFPLAAVYTESGYIVAWLVLVYVLLGVYVFAKKKPALLFGSLIAASLGVCLVCSWAEPWLSDCRMTMLDVGQGQAILLQSSGRTYLVDCGGDYRDEAADITAETLLSQGISRLDGIILTHYDRDHSGGLSYLLTRIETQMLVLPAIEDPDGVGEILRQRTDGAVMYLDRDIIISYDDTNLTIFAPEHDNLGNEGSICVLFQQGNSDILITGDRGMAGERILLHDHDLPQVDVLVAGHHGSKNSTSQELLDEIQPTYAFISVGEDNFYGHPAQELLKRLEEMGCIIYRTDEDSTIVYRG
jgi:competence protein ComEC